MSRLTKDLSFPSTASTSQEGLENNSSSTSNRKLRVTLLSSEWKSTKGGLSTINRELAIQLAKNPNVEVSVYLPQCSEDDKRVARSHNVHLIEAEEMPGYDPVDWLASVPKYHVMDCVIGHGLPLGRQVPHLKRHHNFKWIQVIHTAPEELGMYKSYEDTISKGEKKHQAEVKLCKLADQVVAIGPKLAEAFSGYLRSCRKDQDVLNFTPGIFSEFADVKQATKEIGTFSVLVFGRGDSEDFQLKGYDIAAQAIAELKDMTYKLVFVGASHGEEEKVKEMLLQQGIDRSQLRVRRFQESREQLAELFCEVDLTIMPSRSEGFGLAALEALSAGLPVLVSGNSGLGEALKKVPYGSNCVVESEDPKEWAKAVRFVRQKDRELRLQESKVLCGEYAKKYNWQEQCDRLVERMMSIFQDAQDLSRKASGICPTSGDPLHSGSFPKGSAGIQASGKGKRPLSPSATPAPKRQLTDDHGGDNADDYKKPSHSVSLHKGSLKRHKPSKKGKRPLCASATPGSKRWLTGDHEERHASVKGKRTASPSVTSAPEQLRLSTDSHEGSDNAVVVELLKDEYKRRSQLRPLFWDNTIQLPLKNVYTRLKVVSRQKSGVFPVEDDEVNEYDIFKDLDKGENVMMLVEGSPGIGKTTFCLKLVYDWATKISLHKLEFVLLLKCRDIDGDIMEAISEQLLPEDIKEKTKEKFFDFIKDPDNQKRILIILDGLDELPQKSQSDVSKLLDRKILSCCCILATTRQERGIKVRKKFFFDFCLKIKGFINSDAFEYIRKHFANIGPGHSLKGERLIDEIKANTLLHALRNNPLNLLLLCVVYEDYEGKLPSSRSELYQIIVQCLLRRYCAKHCLKAHKDSKALEKQFEEDILVLGELAWICLLNDRHCFPEDELTERESRNKNSVAREIGLLYKEESLKRIMPQHEYYFLHKTFQEYLAAVYIAQELRTNQTQFFKHLTFDDLVEKYRQVFLFLCGILGEEASILFTQIGEELKSSGDWDWHGCSKKAATFFTESFSESGNAELMAVTLCSFIPFPLVITVDPYDDWEDGYSSIDDFVRVLKACERFSGLQKPVELIAPYNSGDLESDQMKTIVNCIECCSQLTTVSISTHEMTSSLAEALFKGLSASTSLSEFTLKVFRSISCDVADIIGNGLAASQKLTKVTFALNRVWGNAWASALEIGLSADTKLTSVGLEIYSPMDAATIQALGKLSSNKCLTSLSLIICGDMQDSVAAAVGEGLAGQTVLKSFELHVNGNLSFAGANFLDQGILENRSLHDLKVFVRGELPDNWQTILANLRFTKKESVTFAFHPDTCGKVAGKHMSLFCPVAVEKVLLPKHHLTVNIWGELSCKGTEALSEVLVRSPLSCLTLNVHGNLTDSVAKCLAKCLKPHKMLSSFSINIWGKLTSEGDSVLRGISVNNLTVVQNICDVPVVPDESYNALDVSIDDLASLATLFSKVKNTRKKKLSLTINNDSDRIKDWTSYLRDALTENKSLTALDLTLNNFMMNADLGEGLGESLLQSRSLTALSLTINNYTNTTGGWDCTLGDSLAEMTSLTTLSLAINDHNEVSDLRGQGLRDSLMEIETLSTLSITVNGDNMGGFWNGVLFNCLKQNTSLINLYLTINQGASKKEGEDHENFHTYDWYTWNESLAEGLERTTTLITLTLTINNYCNVILTNDCWADSLCEGLSRNTSLTSLTVTVNDYGVSCGGWARDLGNGLAENKSLTTFTLTWNDYSKKNRDKDLSRSLLDSLALNTSLTTFNLSVNICSEANEDWLSKLFNILMRSDSLTTLRLQVNNQCATSGSRIYDFSKLLKDWRSLSLLDLTVSFYGTENEC